MTARDPHAAPGSVSLCCREATRLISESLDRELSVKERVALRLHLLTCRSCIRFRAHLRAIRRMLARSFGETFIEQEEASANAPMPVQLSSKARRRMEDAIAERL